MNNPRRCWWAAAQTIATLILSGLTACGSSPSATPTTSPSATPTLSATDAAILQAYRAEWIAYVSAAHVSDPAYPALAATAVNPLLTQARQTLIYDKEKGYVGRGDVTLLHPHIVSETNGTAVVQDCVYSALILVDPSTGMPVPGQPGGTKPEYDGVRATVVMTAGGIWKVSHQAVNTGSCPAGY
jgi:hypothetical protein